MQSMVGRPIQYGIAIKRLDLLTKPSVFQVEIAGTAPLFIPRHHTVRWALGWVVSVMTVWCSALLASYGAHVLPGSSHNDIWERQLESFLRNFNANHGNVLSNPNPFP
jgi:hypothetical protein